MMFFDPKENTLKILCQEGGYLEDMGGFLTRDMEDMVIPDVMNDVFLRQGR